MSKLKGSDVSVVSMKMGNHFSWLDSAVILHSDLARLSMKDSLLKVLLNKTLYFYSKTAFFSRKK